MQSVTRFPPSPTGYLHIGGARTALFNWLYAKKTGGEMVLRIEDTDQRRSTQAATDAILEAMEWLGLDWHRGPFYQSRRLARYADAVQRLLDEDHAYYCFCDQQKLEAMRAAQRAAGGKPRYDRRCRDLGRRPVAGERAAVRFKNPLQGAVVFDDVVRGRVVIDNHELDDLIIARSDGTPTYHLSVVVDDIDMGITHVIRGDDHTNNTPRQINIFQALGAPLPVFAHVPLISGSDGQRLSKRHGAVSVLDYRDMGILPAALLNYLVRLGWSHGDQEIFSMDEMIHCFAIDNINKSAANFDVAKLLWINQIHIQRSSAADLAKELGERLARRGIDTRGGPALPEVAEAMRARAKTLEEMADKARYLYADFEQYDPKAAQKHLTPAALVLLQAAHAAFKAIENWGDDEINQALQAVLCANSAKLGQIAQPLRVAVSGAAATPPIDATLRLAGKKRVLDRLQTACRWIEQRG